MNNQAKKAGDLTRKIEIYGDFIQSIFSHSKRTQRKECATREEEKKNESKNKETFKSFRDN